jgi:hypothetical protein
LGAERRMPAWSMRRRITSLVVCSSLAIWVRLASCWQLALR